VTDTDSEFSGEFNTISESFVITVLESSVVSETVETGFSFDWFDLINDSSEAEAPEAIIHNIDMYGKVKVVWTQEMFVSEDLAIAIEEEGINLKLESNYEGIEDQLLGFTVENVRSTFMILQLDWDEPFVVSSSPDRDRLILEFT
jgi:hypothetical protein